MTDPTLFGAALPVIQSMAPSIVSDLTSRLKSGADKVRAKFNSTFAHHLQVTYDRCAQVKTIYSEDRPLPLLSIYVNLNLKCGMQVIEDRCLLTQSDKPVRAIITGTGGAGKTMIMRYLSLQHYSTQLGRIPLFVELRNLPRDHSDDFYKAIFSMVTPEREKDAYNIFLEGLRAGAFTLFLDGIDEVPPDYRDEVYKAIQRIPTDFPKLSIVGSTRPEIDVDPWNNFHNFHVDGLSEAQATLLIEKIPFPDDLKAAFLGRIRDGLYKKHQTFLSVPLLCALMLLTFHEFSEVPSRVTVFYEQAFETLYRRHDSAKGVFKRKHSSDLAVDRFRELFAAFCYRTLAHNSVSFTDDQLRRHLAKASEVCEIPVDVEKFAADLVASVCMIMRDGLKLHFIHRSFQDYFAALYLVRYNRSDSYRVFDKVFTDSYVSNVVEMAVDVDAQAVEILWAYPTISKLDDEVRNWPSPERWINLIKQCFYELVVSEDGKTISVYSWTTERLRRPLAVLSRVYPTQGLDPHDINGTLDPMFEHVCDLQTQVELPEEIQTACEDWGGWFEGQDELEVNIENMPLPWLSRTSFVSRADALVRSIHETRLAIEERIARRDEISLLD